MRASLPVRHLTVLRNARRCSWAWRSLPGLPLWDHQGAHAEGVQVVVHRGFAIAAVGGDRTRPPGRRMTRPTAGASCRASAGLPRRRCGRAQCRRHFRRPGSTTATQLHRRRLARIPTGTDLVFTSATGTTLDAHNVRRAFRRDAMNAGLDAPLWTRASSATASCRCCRTRGYLRRTSPGWSAQRDAVAETVYRHQLRPCSKRGGRNGRDLPGRGCGIDTQLVAQRPGGSLRRSTPGPLTRVELRGFEPLTP
ncbi:MAG: Site-specific integrase [Pseudonocardia sp.]|jgi:hypothetical protein|nr:Site-specific integrase [Pseudonocardia sp.]